MLHANFIDRFCVSLHMGHLEQHLKMVPPWGRRIREVWVDTVQATFLNSRGFPDRITRCHCPECSPSPILNLGE